ncbi:MULTISPECIES: cupin domain-containing protein [Thermodesulfovibrio]|jgi:ribulose-bisphosphate carboxylase large chain|uniref:cupin domain-containing protein n=1 Tax=Thermodesulfovibrio TaxID=28261 RepID=UPI0026246E89|nr:cupin domain-containing protein [Thermodesulfovibrio sp.]
MKNKKRQDNFFCEIKERKIINQSRIIRYKNNRWQGIKNIPYKSSYGNWSLIERFPIVYSEDAQFEVRYFEISSGGRSSLEYHNHVHVIICVKGRGKLRIADKTRTLNYLDIAYVAPNEVHQLLNPFKEPFGFICIVDRERDKPVEIEE